MKVKVAIVDAQIALLKKQRGDLDFQIMCLDMHRSYLLNECSRLIYTKREALRMQRFGEAVWRETEAGEAIDAAC